MKIFHGPQNIGGMAGVIAAAQRELGFDAVSHCFSTGNFRFKTDKEILSSNNKFSKSWEQLKFVTHSAFSYDVFQFYFGESLTGSMLVDIPFLKKLGKKIIFYFCGCDIRDSKATIQKYEYSACKECWPIACSANRKKAISTALRYADAIFVSTPDLLEFLPGSVLLPQPIDLHAFEAANSEAILAAKQQRTENNEITIAHAPSNKQIKGTKYVEQAIAELRSQGYLIKLLLIENMPYKEAIYAYATADIAIDQLLIGAYGQCSVEMMALGKPVICYIRDDLQQFYQDNLPIINANSKNIVEIIKKLIEQRDVWRNIGEKGQVYVKNVHASSVIAKKLIKIYQEGERFKCAL